MPRVPQTAVVRLLQGITDSRNIAPGDRISIKPHLLVLGPQDGLAVLKAFRLGGGESVADPSRVLLFSDENAGAHDESPAQRRAQLLEAAKQCGVTSVIPNGGCEVEQNAPYAHGASLDLSSIQLGVLPPGRPWRPLGEAVGERVSTVVIRAGPEGPRAASRLYVDGCVMRNTDSPLRCGG